MYKKKFSQIIFPILGWCWSLSEGEEAAGDEKEDPWAKEKSQVPGRASQ